METTVFQRALCSVLTAHRETERRSTSALLLITMALHSLFIFCLLAISLCILQAQGSKNNYLDCCEATRDVPLKKANRLQSYIIQDPRMGCPLPAIVLITKTGRGLCYPPNSRWALALKRALDARNTQKTRRP